MCIFRISITFFFLPSMAFFKKKTKFYLTGLESQCCPSRNIFRLYLVLSEVSTFSCFFICYKQHQYFKTVKNFRYFFASIFICYLSLSNYSQGWHNKFNHPYLTLYSTVLYLLDNFIVFYSPKRHILFTNLFLRQRKPLLLMCYFFLSTTNCYWHYYCFYYNMSFM